VSGRSRWALHIAPVGLQSASRSIAHPPGVARCPVSTVYHNEVCLWRGNESAGETYTLTSLFTLKSYMAAIAESESMKQGNTIQYTTALDASHRPVLPDHADVQSCISVLQSSQSTVFKDKT